MCGWLKDQFLEVMGRINGDGNETPTGTLVLC